MFLVILIVAFLAIIFSALLALAYAKLPAKKKGNDE